MNLNTADPATNHLATAWATLRDQKEVKAVVTQKNTPAALVKRQLQLLVLGDTGRNIGVANLPPSVWTQDQEALPFAETQIQDHTKAATDAVALASLTARKKATPSSSGDPFEWYPLFTNRLVGYRLLTDARIKAVLNQPLLFAQPQPALPRPVELRVNSGAIAIDVAGSKHEHRLIERSLGPTRPGQIDASFWGMDLQGRSAEFTVVSETKMHLRVMMASDGFVTNELTSAERGWFPNLDDQVKYAVLQDRLEKEDSDDGSSTITGVSFSLRSSLSRAIGSLTGSSAAKQKQKKEIKRRNQRRRRRFGQLQSVETDWKNTSLVAPEPDLSGRGVDSRLTVGAVSWPSTRLNLNSPPTSPYDWPPDWGKSITPLAPLELPDGLEKKDLKTEPLGRGHYERVAGVPSQHGSVAN